MKTFKDLGVTNDVSRFVGEKIKMRMVFGREITMIAYRIDDSKKFPGTQCLHMQIKMDDTMYVIFTGSKAILSTIQKISPADFPFTTTIVNDNGRVLFT